VVIDDPVHGESVETGNSTDVTDGNPTSGASPPEVAPTAILGNDRHLFFSGKGSRNFLAVSLYFPGDR